MKKISTFFGLLLLAAVTFAQAPQAFKYQAVARDLNGNPLTDYQVTIKVSILNGSPEGAVVYSELHNATTNSFGLFDLQIGNPVEVLAGEFASIGWGNASYFLKIEIELDSNFELLGVSQLLSVPYALFAENVAGGVPASLLPPTVSTEVASEIGQNSATFNGIVNGEGFSTTVVFDWGTSIDYGNTITATQSPVTGSTDVAVSFNMTGLQSATTYHYRTKATNAVNVSVGNDMSFITIAGVPVLTTTSVSSILAFSAVSGGNITYDGGAPVTSRGVCWSTNQNPTLSDNFSMDGTGTGSFTSSITGLVPATTYYVRAYATNAGGTAYGNQRNFTTTSGVVTLSTNSISAIQAFTAVSGGNITNNGGSTVISRGVCWSTNQNPTISDSFTLDGVGTGSFTSNITGLVQATTYYVRAYATNAVGTYYGNQRSFTTLSGIISLTTTVVTNITSTTATSGGNITNDGGTPATVRGVCWSLSPNPTLSNNFTSDGSGLGSFTSVLTGLDVVKNYFLRAYATNAVGTFYGNEIVFSTGIGTNYLGGILAYVLQPGDPGYVTGETHGLIAAPSDQSTFAEWGCCGITISGADGTELGTGKQNTLDIVAGCSTAGIAARLCNDLELNGYTDWYLPSKDELNKLYINRAAIGGDASAWYWSSSEYSSDGAWMQYFDYGYQYNNVKYDASYVRAVRAF